MSTLIEYLIKTSDQSFEELSFNEVDGLVLAYVASFLHYTNVKKQGSVKFSELKDKNRLHQFSSRPKQPANRQLLERLSQSKRYGEVAMIHPLEVINPTEKVKFRAITYQLPNANRVVAFKGSDSSMLSWEENSRMLLKQPLPAVLSAMDYLKETMPLTSNAYYLVGYSKGGYIASAASLLLPETVSKQVLAVYNYDGPGISHIEKLDELAKKVHFEHHKFIPPESYIGALFEKSQSYQVVESTVSGLEQHNPHTWNIQNNQLRRLPKISKKSAWLSRLADNLIAASEETRIMKTIDYCFAMLKESNIVSIRDFNQMNVQKFYKIFKHRQALIGENRGYTPLELAKILIMLLSRELKTTVASKKARKLKQINQVKSRLIKEIEKLQFHGADIL